MNKKSYELVIDQAVGEIVKDACAEIDKPSEIPTYARDVTRGVIDKLQIKLDAMEPEEEEQETEECHACSADASGECDDCEEPFCEDHIDDHDCEEDEDEDD